MKLTVLGCAGSFPGPDSACSAYLVEADGFRLLVDFGAGSLSALQRYLGLHSLDAIFLSHLHPDHVVDAASYVVVRRYDPSGPLPRLPLYGPAGTAERLATVYGPDRVSTVDDVYDIHTLTPGVVSIGPFRVEVDRMNHPVETYGARIEHAGLTLAYSADTGVSDVLVNLARDADLLLCEASYLESEPHPADLHLTGREAGEHARKAGARRLVLTHLVHAWGDADATLAEAKAVFDGPIELAKVGTTYELTGSSYNLA
jgi:ribonuclease BN (tRNA processing enzyme)